MMWQLQLVLCGADIFLTTVQTLNVLAQWLATPDGANITMAFLCSAALLEVPTRLVLLATLCVHLALLVI